MDELVWALVGAAFMVTVFYLMNRMYGRIHGHRLKWRWMWLSHGALLFATRLPAYEEQSARQAS